MEEILEIWFIGRSSEPLQFFGDEALIVSDQLDAAINEEKKIAKIVLGKDKICRDTYNIYVIRLEQISYYMYQNRNEV